jgi:3-deoxy-7-phosphoheptulonate synthase
MWITLKPGVAAVEVRGALQALGLWTEPLQSQLGGADGLWVQPQSRRVSPEEILAIPGVQDLSRAGAAWPRVEAQAGRAVQVGPVSVGGGAAPVLMAGPCSVESPAQILAAAEVAARAGAQILRGGVFKPRSSPYAFRGVGAEGLSWMREAADAFGLQVVTEVMREGDVARVAEFAELIQIGSRNMQNFGLLEAVGAAGRPVLLKRGMAAYVEDWLLAGEYLLAAGCPGVMYCERGVRGFDPQTRNLLDLGAVALLKEVYGQVVVVDPSHSAGRRDLIGPLSRAAVAAGADGLIVESHPDPAQARSDGPQALWPEELGALARSVGRWPREER